MNATSEVAHAWASSASVRLRRRPARMAAVAVVILAGALVTIVATRSVDRRYGPIRSGPFGGIYSTQGLFSKPDDFSYRLLGRSDATAQLLASLNNTGSHSVKVTAIDTDDVVTKVRWSELHTAPGGSVSGNSTPWRDLPAVIPARSTIRLLITIRRPANCSADRTEPRSEDLYSGSHRVHWKSLLHTHTTSIDDQITNIRLC